MFDLTLTSRPDFYRHDFVAFDYSGLEAFVVALEAGQPAPIACEDPTVFGVIRDRDECERLHRLLEANLEQVTECWSCGQAKPKGPIECDECKADREAMEAREALVTEVACCVECRTYHQAHHNA